MERRRTSGQRGINSFIERLTRRFGLSEWTQSRIEFLDKNGIPRAEIFRMITNGLGDPEASHWSGSYREGKLKEGKTKHRQFKKSH
jgi:hypothetical protein